MLREILTLLNPKSRLKKAFTQKAVTARNQAASKSIVNATKVELAALICAPAMAAKTVRMEIKKRESSK